MAQKYWLKLYYEMLDDIKVARLSDHLWRRLVECFLLAGDTNRGGKLPPLDEIAFRLRENNEELLEADLIELQRLGFLQSKDNVYTVTNFEKRQKPLPKREYMRRARDDEQKETYYQGVTNGNADKITDIDIDKITDTEALQNSDLSDLLDAFVNATGIPFGGSPEKWLKSLASMKAAGVEPEDITLAVEILYDGDYSVVSPQSVHNTAISEMGKRKGKSKKKPTKPVKEY
jgi:hypothetical protein